MTAEPMTAVEWLRRLLDDAGGQEVEESYAQEGQTEFFIAAPPMSAAPTVIVNGKVEGGGWSVPATADEVIFATGLTLDTQVVIRYVKQTFSEKELETYLLEAMTEYVAARHVVYRAAIFAIDTLLIGTAVAFDFGAGDESFRFSDVFTRLETLRAGLETWLTTNAEEGRLYVQDMTFDSLEPGDIEWDIGGTEFATGGYYPDQPGGGVGSGGLS